MNSTSNAVIRLANLSDVHAICDIYNHFITESIATFEEQAVTASVMKSRMSKSPNYPWFVAEVEGEVVGYAYASRWKERSAYRYTVETSVYINHQHTGKGYAVYLYKRLIAHLKARGMKVLLAGISLPNDDSVKFHERFGFEKVGQLRDVGFKFGKFIDVGYWELRLDGNSIHKKSPTIG